MGDNLVDDLRAFAAKQAAALDKADAALAASQAEVERLRNEVSTMRRNANARFEKAKGDGLTIRKACRMREPLGGADAECLEHALTMTEQERDTAVAREGALRASLEQIRDDAAKDRDECDRRMEAAGLQVASHLGEIAQAALDAAPSPACPSCERTTKVLTTDEYTKRLDQLHRTPPGDTGDSVWRLMQSLVDHDAALRSEAAAALAHAEGTHETDRGCRVDAPECLYKNDHGACCAPCLGEGRKP